MMRPQDEDTIVATATPPGYGGISVVRVSGEKAVSIAKKFCSRLPGQPKSHQVYYGFFEYSGVTIDEVMVTYFAKGSSFTTEETIEISCHGSPLITQKMVELISQSGARVAEPGEFTYRAYMNGRIDLVQAEGVLHMIESQSSRQSEEAMQLLKGHLSSQLGQIKDDLTWILANLEAGIDFVEEGLELSSLPGLTDRCDKVAREISQLTENYHVNRRVFEGFEIALIGCPNAGKSSLLNAVMKSDQAIVTDQPGTTRDLVTGERLIDGILTRFVDTAGLRESHDQVERIGIEKTFSMVERSDLAVFVVSPDLELDEQLSWMFKLPKKPDLILVSKSDLPASSIVYENIKKNKEIDGIPCLIVCTFKADSVDRIINYISKSISYSPRAGESLILARHHEFLQNALDGLRKGRELLDKDESPEFVAAEFQISLRCVKDILGERFDDDVMNRVFKDFCIGK